MARFHSFYWRQFALTAGMVALTMFLLGSSFFALTYNYTLREQQGEMEEQADLVAQLASSYFSGSGFTGDQDLRTLATVAASLSESAEIIVCWCSSGR